MTGQGKTAGTEALRRRIKVLEDEKKVSECMHRYMRLCDDLDTGFDLQPLIDLFTEDAIWEGKGNRYAKTFGSYAGREAVKKMFSKYTRKPGHFDFNVHFLCNESIAVKGKSATGSWLLLQPSTFSNKKSQLSAARISASFRNEKRCWLISHFQTENLFSRPEAKPWNSPKPLLVPK